MSDTRRHNRTRRSFPLFWLRACVLTLSVATVVPAQEPANRGEAAIPRSVMLQIVRAEDERRWDNDLRDLLSDKNAAIRRHATLAAGRIGDENAVLPLVSVLQNDQKYDVRAMAAFALGETESAAGAEALAKELVQLTSIRVRARALEAL